MAKRFAVRFALDGEDTQLIIDALRSSKGDRPATNRERHLADIIEHDMAGERRTYEAEIAAAEELARYRAKRAENHELTERQANCLSGIRAGRGPWQVAERRTFQGQTYWRSSRSRSMGGAVGRMVQALIEEGLLTERRELTPEGLARLEAWEIENPGKVPALGEEVR